MASTRGKSKEKEFLRETDASANSILIDQYFSIPFRTPGKDDSCTVSLQFMLDATLTSSTTFEKAAQTFVE